MLTADELTQVEAALAEADRRRRCDYPDAHRDAIAAALYSACCAYRGATARSARLDCLTTAVRALAGALRDRLAQ